MSESGDKICMICHRPESEVGKLIHMPGDICICPDCMQHTFDTLNNYGGIPGMDMPSGAGAGATPATDAVVDATEPETTVTNDVAEEVTEDKDRSTGKGSDGVEFTRFPNIGMINLGSLSNLGNLGDIFGQFGQPARAKAKKPKKSEDDIPPAIDIKNIPPPHKIKALLDDYVVGQEYAKKVMSVAVYNHYKRVIELDNEVAENDGVEIEKSNMLMIGPTGSGKTYMVRTLAKLLDVPLAITDATSLTEAGYIGDDIESVVSKLLAAADNDVDRAERGIIFIDEIDKLAKKRNTNQRDVSGESVQQGMLKLLEGSEIEVPVGASSKNAMVPMAIVDTKNILFICGGAFPDLEDIIKERLNKSSSMGFVSDLKDKYDKDKNILTKVEVEDIRKFGMIPEFIGRLPIIFSLESLDEDMYVKILTEPKNAITKQYKKLLAYDEVNLEFDDAALHAIAKKAMERELGARALRSIIEEFMLDIMYEIPKDSNIGTVRITEDYIEKKGGPRITMRDKERMTEQPKIATAAD